jgi:aminoglycoside phosphotransferase
VDDAMGFLYQWQPPGSKTVSCLGDYRLPDIFFLNDTLEGFIDLEEFGVTDVW